METSKMEGRFDRWRRKWLSLSFCPECEPWERPAPKVSSGHMGTWVWPAPRGLETGTLNECPPASPCTSQQEDGFLPSELGCNGNAFCLRRLKRWDLELCFGGGILNPAEVKERTSPRLQNNPQRPMSRSVFSDQPLALWKSVNYLNNMFCLLGFFEIFFREHDFPKGPGG